MLNKIAKIINNKNKTTYCATKENKKKRRNNFKRELDLHFRMLYLVKVVIKHCKCCNYLFAKMLITRSKNKKKK